MKEQLAPDQSVVENELICEKLLGWKRAVRGTLSGCQFWDTEPTQLRTLSFSTWEEAGLILDAMQAADLHVSTISHPDGWTYVRVGLGQTARGNTGPLAIRLAALEYINAVRP